MSKKMVRVKKKKKKSNEDNQFKNRKELDGIDVKGKERKTKALFGKDPEDAWIKEWKNMPQYNNVKGRPKILCVIKCDSEKEWKELQKLLTEKLYNNDNPFTGRQNITVKQTWWPRRKKGSDYEYE